VMRWYALEFTNGCACALVLSRSLKHWQ